MRTFIFILLSWLFCKSTHGQKSLSDSLEKVLFTQNIQDSERVIILNKYSYSLLFTKPNQMAQYADEAMVISQKLKWQTGIAKSFIAQAVAASYGQNNQISAVDYYQKAIEANTSGYDRTVDFKANSGIATIFYNQKQYDKALEYYQKAYAILKKNGITQNEDVLLMNFGNVYYDLGKKDSAIFYYGKSMAIAEENNNIMIKASLLNSFGMIYLQKGKYDTAYQLLKRSVAISRDAGNTLMQANSLVNISLAKPKPTG